MKTNFQYFKPTKRSLTMLSFSGSIEQVVRATTRSTTPNIRRTTDPTEQLQKQELANAVCRKFGTNEAQLDRLICRLCADADRVPQERLEKTPVPTTRHVDIPDASQLISFKCVRSEARSLLDAMVRNATNPHATQIYSLSSLVEAGLDARDPSNPSKPINRMQIGGICPNKLGGKEATRVASRVAFSLCCPNEKADPNQWRDLSTVILSHINVPKEALKLCYAHDIKGSPVENVTGTDGEVSATLIHEGYERRAKMIQKKVQDRTYTPADGPKTELPHEPPGHSIEDVLTQHMLCVSLVQDSRKDGGSHADAIDPFSSPFERYPFQFETYGGIIHDELIATPRWDPSSDTPPFKIALNVTSKDAFLRGLQMLDLVQQHCRDQDWPSDLPLVIIPEGPGKVFDIAKDTALLKALYRLTPDTYDPRPASHPLVRMGVA